MPNYLIRFDRGGGDELFDAVVAPLGLRWRIDGDQLTIDAPR